MHRADLRHPDLRIEVGLRHIAQVVVESIEHDAVRRARIADERPVSSDDRSELMLKPSGSTYPCTP